ncbi:MAG: hypothetical protein ACHQ53_06360 [Polyangiales bacterium]
MSRRQTQALASWLVVLVAFWSTALVVRAQSDDKGEHFYRYVNAAGHVVYTNILEQVPLEQRPKALVSLRKVELNTETGNALRQNIDEQYAALQGSSYCQNLRAAADTGFIDKLWSDDKPEIACGGAVLLLLLLSPVALRRFGAPAGARVLTLALPALGLAALTVFAMTSTNDAIVALKERVKPCLNETFAKLGAEKDALTKQTQLVDQLKKQIEALQQ